MGQQYVWRASLYISFFSSYSHSKLPLYVTARVEYFFTGLDNCISTWFNTNNYLYNVPSRN